MSHYSLYTPHIKDGNIIYSIETTTDFKRALLFLVNSEIAGTGNYVEIVIDDRKFVCYNYSELPNIERE